LGIVCDLVVDLLEGLGLAIDVEELDAELAPRVDHRDHQAVMKLEGIGRQRADLPEHDLFVAGDLAQLRQAPRDDLEVADRIADRGREHAIAHVTNIDEADLAREDLIVDLRIAIGPEKPGGDRELVVLVAGGGHEEVADPIDGDLGCLEVAILTELGDLDVGI